MPGVFLRPSAFASDLDHTGREVGHGGTRMTRMVSAGFQGKNYSKTQGFHPSNLGLPMNFQSKPALQLSFSSENGVPGYPQFPKDYNGFIYIYIYIYNIYIHLYTYTYIYINTYYHSQQNCLTWQFRASPICGNSRPTLPMISQSIFMIPQPLVLSPIQLEQHQAFKR